MSPQNRPKPHRAATFIKQPLAAFARDDSGALGIIFALSAVPMLLLVGMAIDSTRASAVKSEIQIGLDKAVIAGAQRLAMTGQASAATKAVRQRFTASEAARHKPEVTVSANPTSGMIDASASLVMPTTFLTLIGYPDLSITAESRAATQPEKSNNQPKAPPAKKPSQLNDALASLSESDVERLIGQVSDACYRLRDYRLDRNVPQCASVFDGTFETKFRQALSTNTNAQSLLPAGVRLAN